MEQVNNVKNGNNVKNVTNATNVKNVTNVKKVENGNNVNNVKNGDNVKNVTNVKNARKVKNFSTLFTSFTFLAFFTSSPFSISFTFLTFFASLPFSTFFPSSPFLTFFRGLPFFTFFTFLTFFTSSVDAYFQRWGESVVEAGRVGTGAALSGSTEWFWGNPAALAGLQRWEGSADYLPVWYGLTDGSSLAEGGVRVGGPWGGASWAAGWQTRGLTGFFFERAYGVSVARSVPGDDHQQVGLTVKWLEISQQAVLETRNNPAFARYGAGSFSMDLGWVGQVWSSLWMSWSVRDVFQPSLSFLDEKAPLPLEWIGGASWVDGESWSFTGSFRAREGAWTAGTGVEYRIPEEPIELRAGLELASFPGGVFGWSRLGLGATYQMKASWGVATLNYAWTFPLGGGFSGGWGVHRIGISMVEGSSPSLPTTEEPAKGLSWKGLPSLLGYTRLLFPSEEWNNMSPATVAGEAPSERHRRAILTALVAGRTAGDEAFQAVIGEQRSPFDAVALRVIHHLRYGPPQSVQTLLAEAYREVVTRPEAPPEAWLTLGFLEAEGGEWPRAMDAYRRWWSSGVDRQSSPGGAYTMALSALQISDLALAEAGLALLLETVPDHVWVKELQGKLFAARNRHEEALGMLKEAERLAASDDWKIRTKLHQALVLLNTDRPESFDQALALVDEVVRLWPGNEQAEGVRRDVVDRAVASLMKAGQRQEEQLLLREALERFRQVLKIQPNHPAAAARAARLTERITEQVQSHSLRARESMERGDFETAMLEWRLVQDADPGDATSREQIQTIFPVIVLKARDRLRESDHAEAVRLLRLLERFQPQDEKVLGVWKDLKGEFVSRAAKFEAGEELGRARGEWERFLKVAPEDAEAASTVARLRDEGTKRATGYVAEAEKVRRVGDIPSALLLIERALRVEPSWPGALALQGQLQAEKDRLLGEWLVETRRAVTEGREDVARDRIQKILRWVPDHPEAKEKLIQLEGQKTKQLVKWYQAAREAEAVLKPDEALVQLKLLLSAHPGHEEGLALRKTILDRLEQARASREESDQEKLRGDILYGGGRVAEAIAAWEKARAKDYYNRELVRKIEDGKREINK